MRDGACSGGAPSPWRASPVPRPRPTGCCSRIWIAEVTGAGEPETSGRPPAVRATAITVDHESHKSQDSQQTHYSQQYHGSRARHADNQPQITSVLFVVGADSGAMVQPSRRIRESRT